MLQVYPSCQQFLLPTKVQLIEIWKYVLWNNVVYINSSGAETRTFWDN